MDVKSFLDALHFNVDGVRPLDYEPDWDDAPLPYKLYRHRPVVPLSAQVPLTLEHGLYDGNAAGTLPLRALHVGHFLWYSYGLTRVSETVVRTTSAEYPVEADPFRDVMYSYRRFVPSGGALYPNELYVYLKAEDVAPGLYHYDAAHHRLVGLREGNFDEYMEKALGHRAKVSECLGMVFVSTVFWKNFFKYHNFSYRLQGLDTGVLVGQLLEMAPRFGLEAQVYYHFVDRAVNHLLGLAENEETVYAVIPLSQKAFANSGLALHTRHDAHLATPASDMPRVSSGSSVSAEQLCQELPELKHDHYVKSRRLVPYPMLVQANQACYHASTDSFQRTLEIQTGSARAVGRFGPGGSVGSVKSVGGNGTGIDSTVPLPRVSSLSYDLAAVCRQRISPGEDFVLEKIDDAQLAALLSDTVSRVYQRDWLQSRHKPSGQTLGWSVDLYLCLYKVDGLLDGAYQYDVTTHSLRLVRAGDHRDWLQRSMSVANVNLFQVPLCFHVVGNRSHYVDEFGVRGYRIQQMEAGVLVQKLLLAATALGMGGNPLLSFDTKLCDELYNLNLSNQTCLIQIPIGFYRSRPKLEGSLRS